MKKLFMKWLSALLIAAVLLCPVALSEDAEPVADADGEIVAIEPDTAEEESDAAEAEPEAEIACDTVDEVLSEDAALELSEDETLGEAEELDLGGAEDALPLMAASSSVAVNATNFPDSNFRQYVSDNIDINPRDGYLSASEIAAVKEIDVDAYSLRHDLQQESLVVRSLKGIEFFPNLERLNCYWCILSTLDISKNTALTYLNCAFTKLTTLDITKNTALTELYCEACGLRALDVSQNRGLRILCCYGNDIATLDVRNLVNILPYVKDQYKTLDDKGGFHGGYKICTYKNQSASWQSNYVELCCAQSTKVVTSAASSDSSSASGISATSSVISISVLKNTRASVNVGSICQIELGGKTGTKYKSSKKKVATVDASGRIAANAAGKTKITFKVGRKRRMLTLTVVDPTIPKSVSLSMSGTVSVKQGDTVTLAAVLPAGTSSGIKWKSSRKSVATVNNGVVTFKRKGSVTITATTVRGKKKAKVKFKVAKYDAKKDLANYGWRTVQGTTGDRKLVFRKTHTGGYMSNHKFAEGDQIFVNLTWREGGDAIAYDNGTYGYVQAKYIAW